MKKHNTIKVVLVTILVLMLLSWIIPAAYYSNGYVDQGRIQMGLFDLFSYPLTSLSYFGYIALFVLAVGAFYGVLNKIGAYRLLLDKIVNLFAGNEKIAIAIFMILIAVLSSLFGVQLAFVLFFPFIISLVLLMGYDKYVAALTVVGSTMIGMAGSTFAYNNVGLLTQLLSLKLTSLVYAKLVILVVGLGLLIFNTIKYIDSVGVKKIEVKKAKTSKTSKSKTTKKSSTKAAVKEDSKIVVSESIAEDDLNKFIPSKKDSSAILPLAIITLLIFVVTVLAFVSWAGAFNIKAFSTVTESVTTFSISVWGAIVIGLIIPIVVAAIRNSGVKTYAKCISVYLGLVVLAFLFSSDSVSIPTFLNGKFNIFGVLLGSVKEFGSWTVSELSVVVILATLLISLIYGISIDEMFDGIKKGAVQAVKPAIIVILLYTCLVIVTYHPFQLVIYKNILGVTKGFNVLTTSIVAIISSIFNVESSYVFNSSVPYLTSVVGKGSYPLIGVIYQSLYGLSMLAAPTSLILMVVLSYLDIPYCKWLKTIWKLLLELLAVFAVIFIILALI